MASSSDLSTKNPNIRQITTFECSDYMDYCVSMPTLAANRVFPSSAELSVGVESADGGRKKTHSLPFAKSRKQKGMCFSRSVCPIYSHSIVAGGFDVMS